MKFESGQAMIECIAFFLVMVVLLSCFLSLTEWFLTRQRLLVAVREAALLYSSGRFTKEEVQARIKSTLAQGMPTLPCERVQVYCEPASGWQAKVFVLDRIRVQYRPTSIWVSRVEPVMEEQCTIKHAAHYGPLLQKLWGPPVPQ
jgi:hypothetical protein